MYLKLLDEVGVSKSCWMRLVYLKTAGWVCVSKSCWMTLVYLKLLDEFVYLKAAG